MKNIYLIIMSKSVAPTELKHNGLLPFYKGATPTELFAFSKMDISSVKVLDKLREEGLL